MSAADLAQTFRSADAEARRGLSSEQRDQLAAIAARRRGIALRVTADEAEAGEIRAATKKDNEAAEAAAKASAPAEPEQTNTNNAGAEAAPSHSGPVAKYADFIARRGQLFTRLATIAAAFEYGASVDESDMRAASLGVVFSACEGWLRDAFGTKAAATIDQLEAEGSALKEDGADVSSVALLRTAYDHVAALYKAHGSRWHREQKRRENREANLANFDSDRKNLLNWCRQSMSTLANLAEPDEVQDFCASFYNNTAVMESNFLVLMEMSEALLPSETVEAQLMELAEVWLTVETQAFEKLRATLLELHAKSGVEAQARMWPELADRFAAFVRDSQDILNIPTDAESVAVAAPMKEAGKALQADAEPHRMLVAHLSDYTLREECLKEHYNAIRKIAFSKLTLMTQAFPGLYAYPRKSEYTDRMAELSDWVEAKSCSKAWKDLLARVDRMKRLIEDNELTLSNTEDSTQ